jgi:hypothetical protein
VHHRPKWQLAFDILDELGEWKLAPPVLLAEWPHGEPAPIKYWLSNLPETTPLVELVRLARSRWRVEQDYRWGACSARLR